MIEREREGGRERGVKGEGKKENREELVNMK